MEVKEVVESVFTKSLEQAEAKVPDAFSDDMILLESGLDSLGFAILVTQLEQELGYDPFVLMEEPVYPRTFGEFVGIYEKFSDHRK